MPKKLSTLFKVSSTSLQKEGVFDAFVDLDSRLHIDPSLLGKSKVPEFQDAHQIFERYFQDVLVLIENSQQKNDIFWRKALSKLHFKEIGSTALGYSKSGTGGSAIGSGLANNILTSVSQIVSAGIKDPVIFELVGLFEEDIGADRISDMTIAILVENFAQYTQRVCKKLNIKSRAVKIRGTEYFLPINYDSRKPILFVPKDLLRDLPVAHDWDDIDRVCRYNEELREKVNRIIGNSWKEAIKIPKRQFKQILLDNPQLLVDLIEQYKQKPKHHYDFTNDPIGEIIWAELSEKAPESQPLDLHHYKPVNAENILNVVMDICEQFRSLIENNGWYEYLYDQTGKLKRERAPQLLFYGIAEAYCKANDLDLNREIDSGVGSLDFKLSRGYSAKVNVELKYSKNPGLIRGFEHQLPTYNKAEKNQHERLSHYKN